MSMTNATVPSRGKWLQTDVPTDRPTDVPTTSAAERPSRAADVVAAYQRAAKATGNLRFLDVRSRAILGAQAKRLMSDDWPVPLLVRAAERFAGTQRNPSFLAEWVRIEYADQREAEWAAIKAEDTPKRAAETMRWLGQAMRELGLG